MSLRFNNQGHSVPQIAKRLERAEQTVRAWLKAYQREGIEGLSAAPRPGRPPLKGQALDQQLEILRNHSPADFGYLEAAWTVGLIRHQLASRQLEVSDSTVRRQTYGGAVGSTNASPERCLAASGARKKARVADPKSPSLIVASISERRLKCPVEVFFVDETHFSDEPYLQRGWFRCGVQAQTDLLLTLQSRPHEIWVRSFGST